MDGIMKTISDDDEIYLNIKFYILNIRMRAFKSKINTLEITFYK